MKRSTLQDAIRCSSVLYVFISLALALARTSAAFQVTNMYHTAPSTALHAWSLPHETSFTFRTWYNEYNPIARVTVYNE